MKRILLLLVCLPTIVLGQLTYIPNDSFEQYLVNNGFDTQMDDYALTSIVEEIDSLFLDGYTITNFQGIEDFSSLEYLYYYSSQNISSIDL